MGFLKDFLFFLTDADGATYRVGDTGIVETTTTPAPIPVGPNGVDDIVIEYGRSDKYKGLFRSFTTPLKFVKQGGKILRTLLLAVGIESRVYLVIHRLNKTFGGAWQHDFFYKAELDLSQSAINPTDVTVNVMEGDLTKLFRANENTVYEIPVEGVSVKMDGCALKAVTTFAIMKPLAAQSLGRKQIIPMRNVITEGNFFNFSFATDYGDVVDGAFNEITTEDLVASEKWLFKTYKARRAIIRVRGGIIGPGSGNAGNTWYIETSAGQLITLGTITVASPGAVATPFDFSAEVTLAADEKVYVYRSSTVFNNNGLWNYDGETKIEVTTIDRANPSFVKAIPAYQLGQLILNKLTNSTDYTFESDYLATEWPGLLLTGFDAIRGIEGAKMKISFSQFIDAINVPCAVATEIKDSRVIVKKVGDVYPSGPVTDLGTARDFVAKPAQSYQFNTVKIGYPDMKSTDPNGRDEFNTYTTWVSPVTRVSKELAIISPGYASQYEIELARVGLGRKNSSQNTETDNDFALIHADTTPQTGGAGEPATYYNLYRATYTTFTGIFDPESAFNVELSPKRCLLKHGPLLRAVFFGLETGKLRFSSCPKNAEMNTDGLKENGDVTIADLAPAPLFIPWEVTFKSQIPDDLVDVMDTDPNRVFAFEWDGVTYKAHANSVKIQPAANPEQEFNGLLQTGTNLTTLI